MAFITFLSTSALSLFFFLIWFHLNSSFPVCVFLTLLSCRSSEFRSPSHGGNLNRSASLSCTERAQESGSISGSQPQIPGTPFQYIPDFSVRALTDLQYVKVPAFNKPILDKIPEPYPDWSDQSGVKFINALVNSYSKPFSQLLLQI